LAAASKSTILPPVVESVKQVVRARLRLLDQRPSSASADLAR
jgi:hypothetical protein